MLPFIDVVGSPPFGTDGDPERVGGHSAGRPRVGPPEERPAADAVRAVRAAIRAACERAGRSAEEVLLIGASKTVSADRVRAVLEAGVTDFAENYANELEEKALAVPEARWHFIGKLQGGTVRHVAERAAVVHTLEPGHALQRLARRVAAGGRRVDGLIQVDETGRRQGVPPEGVSGFADEVATMDGIRLIGLMTLPPATDGPEAARPHFRRLREMRDELRERHPDLRDLSMGMSGDFEIAVEEGATMVRVGTALFGGRPARRAGDGGGDGRRPRGRP